MPIGDWQFWAATALVALAFAWAVLSLTPLGRRVRRMRGGRVGDRPVTLTINREKRGRRRGRPSGRSCCSSR